MHLSFFKNLKSPYVLILVGTPLAGKSFFCNSFIKEINPDIDIISRDQILLDVHGSDDYNAAFSSVNQKEVDKKLISEFSRLSREGKNVIVDMTHMTSKRRRYNLSFFGKEYYKLAVIFPILTEEQYAERNKKRTLEENKSIPLHVLRSMISSYQPISSSEGFNHTISIK